MIVASTMRAGKAVKDKAGFDNRLSKTVALNSNNRLFFKVTPVLDGDGEDTGLMDIITAVVPGRTTDFEVCGTGYIKLRDEQMEYDESTDKYVDKSGLGDWARVAKVLHAAACANEKKKAEKQAREDAADVGTEIDRTLLENKILKIEQEYYGGKDAQGNNIAPKKSPIISSLQYKTTTQVLVVPLLEENKPDFSKAQTAYVELSTKKINQLIGILEDKNYCPAGSEYLEVGYRYMGTNAQEAGISATFQGISQDTSLKHLYPEIWEKNARQAFDKMVKGSNVLETAELMAGRNINLNGTKTVADIESSVRKYCSQNPGILGSINFEEDDTKRAASIMLKEGLCDGAPKPLESLKALVAQMEAEKNAQNEEAVKVDEEEIQENKVIEAAKKTGEATTIGAIADSAIDVDALAGADYSDEM